ncbi:auxin-responsive protein IAA31-like [Aristolochia californica]|uniref:auxin-responsive protein IAA31-like n=1 Tax=Aristolochia californica TaxID=171875 RepID=UPI0035D80DAD
MELELGLALPDHPTSFFDLNCDDPKETRILTTKRPFYEAFEDTRSSTPTLPLLWTPHPRKDDDDEIPADSSYARPNEKSVVGWPPVKSWRKRHCTGGAAPYKQGAAAQSLYVKVKMDGAAIGRKIDLSNCDSYQKLTSTLSRMFGIDETSAIGTHTRYTLTYQDKEGDWLLVGDATWETFIESVHRLKIRKKGQ